MTKFDAYIKSIITEAKCHGPSLMGLSDKPEYRFSRCVANPYSSGYKKIYFSRRGEKFDVRKCKRARPGTANYENCKLIKRALLRKLRKLKHKKD